MEVPMKKLISTLFVSFITLVGNSYATACDELKAVNVQFAKGKSSSNYKGQITGTQYYSYHFIAKKGQKLKVKIDGGNVDAYLFNDRLKDSVYMSKYSPELDTDGAYTLPYSGEYELRVLQPRSQARLGKTPKYNLQISIK
ncbi:hypothetical protein [Psychrobacter sp. H7-1]|uniref:hypothetical protein n=1 Tax=Psychrobacter sp. H7-1 TaxID=1569265 RepID=UPI0019192DED|nr:hypothetical protein [Psychrobacter sp. H7-1]